MDLHVLRRWILSIRLFLFKHTFCPLYICSICSRKRNIWKSCRACFFLSAAEKFNPSTKRKPTFIVFIAILHFLFTTGERVEPYLGRSLDLKTVWTLCWLGFPSSVVFCFAIFSSKSWKEEQKINRDEGQMQRRCLKVQMQREWMKKRVAGEATSTERRKKSDSFDSWVTAADSEATEGWNKRRIRKRKAEERPRLEQFALGLYES